MGTAKGTTEMTARNNPGLWYERHNKHIAYLKLDYATAMILMKNGIITIKELREKYYNKKILYVKGIGSKRYRYIYSALSRYKKQVKTLERS